MISEHLSRAGTSAAEVLRFLIGHGLIPYHCKSEDFSPKRRNSFEVPPERIMTMTVRGRKLTVAPVDMDVASRGRFFTDILAIRRDSHIARVVDA